MWKQTSVLFILILFSLTTFACGKTAVKDVVNPVEVVEKENKKIDCPENTVYLEDRTSIKNTILYVCLNEEGRAEGKIIAFYLDTNKIKAIAELKNGTKIGKWVKWDKSGELISIENYNENGLYHGYLISWENNGADRYCMIFTFADGVLLNLALEYKNKKIFKILKLKNKTQNTIEIDTKSLTEKEIEYLNELYTVIISEETKGIPIP